MKRRHSVPQEVGSVRAISGKVGIRFAPDPKAPAEARSELAGDKELLSSDASVKAIKPKVAEILVGY